MKKTIFIMLMLFIAPLLLQAEIKTIAIYVTTNSKNQNLTDMIQNQITSKLLNSRTFRIVERDRLGGLAKERKYAALGFTNSKMTKMGKELGVDYIIGASWTPATSTAINVDIRLIRISDGLLIAAENENAPIYDVTGNISKMTNKLLASFKPHSFLKAMFSAVLPGAPQYYNNSNAKGTIFLLAGLGAMGSAAYFGMDYNKKYNSYMSATTEPDITNKYNSAKSVKLLRDYSILAYGGLVALSMVDGFLGTIVYNLKRNALLSYNGEPHLFYSLENKGVRVSYRIRY